MNAKVQYKVAKRVTVPLSKLNAGQPIAVQFTGEPTRFIQIDSKPDKEGKMKAPAPTLRCVNLDTGELIDLITPMVLLSQLDREYGGHEEQLAGKMLLIESTGKRPGKEYFDIVVSELAES